MLAAAAAGSPRGSDAERQGGHACKLMPPPRSSASTTRKQSPPLLRTSTNISLHPLSSHQSKPSLQPPPSSHQCKLDFQPLPPSSYTCKHTLSLSLLPPHTSASPALSLHPLSHQSKNTPQSSSPRTSASTTLNLPPSSSHLPCAAAACERSLSMSSCLAVACGDCSCGECGRESGRFEGWVAMV